MFRKKQVSFLVNSRNVQQQLTFLGISKMTNLKLFGLVLFSTAIALMSGPAHALTATVDFESQVVGTQFGGSPAPLSNSPGDLVFTEDGVGVHVDNFTQGAFVGFISVTIGGFTDPSFPTTPATISNIRLDFDISGLGGPVTSASFHYADFGGDENLVINGTVIELSDFVATPAVVAGVNVFALWSPIAGGTKGTVTLTGPISSLAIGGQELGIDDVSFQYVPEPTSISLLALVAGAALLRRQRS